MPKLRPVRGDSANGGVPIAASLRGVRWRCPSNTAVGAAARGHGRWTAAGVRDQRTQRQRAGAIAGPAPRELRLLQAAQPDPVGRSRPGQELPGCKALDDQPLRSRQPEIRQEREVPQHGLQDLRGCRRCAGSSIPRHVTLLLRLGRWRRGLVRRRGVTPYEIPGCLPCPSS